MIKSLFTAATLLAMLPARASRHLEKVHEQLTDRADRGDGPIPTVIIVVASVTGALLIAGGLAVLFGRANGRLLDLDFGD
ncbi:hypothetical protein [Streptomyces sp. N35]|uniref:hypothetical protein n=1 Tax=Streptomyces sp. N35 TaxID=2795730 RepID=UPI001F350FD1|nr:hypothetical protein [Streptomyces sp. N35]